MTIDMATLRRRLGPCDRGAATIWYAIFAFTFLIMVGLVVDYGGAITAKHHAQIAADEAARAAGQSVVKPLGVRGVDVVVDPGGATAAAQHYLSSAHVEGTVVPVAPRVLMVSTSETYQPKILTVIGVGPKRVTGSATVNLNHVGKDADAGGAATEGGGVLDELAALAGGGD